MTNRHKLVSSLAISWLALVASPRASRAQDGNDLQLRNSVTVLGGAFMYDMASDAYLPFVSGSLGRSLSRFVELEGTLSYARLTTTLYSLTPTITSYNVRTPFLAADARANLTLPLGRFVPYVGASVGAFRRNAIHDSSNGIYGPAVSGSSLGAAVGARLLLTPRVGLRGEFHYRQDSHNGFTSPANDVAESLGLMYRF